MATDILIIFRFKGPAMSLMVDNKITFQEFKTTLSANGVSDDFINAQMISKTEKHDECTLANDQHWRNILFLMKSSSTDVVTITSTNFIEPASLNQAPIVVVPQVLNSSSLLTSSLGSETNISLDEDALLQLDNQPHINIPVVEDKVLLTAPWANYIRGEGQVFKGGVQQFRVHLSKYMLEKGYKFDFVRNTNKQVMAKCAHNESHACKWYINATYAKENLWFYIRTFTPEHRCPMNVRSSHRLSAKMIGTLIVEIVKNDPSVTANEIIDLFKREYGLTISYQQAWRGIECAQDLIYGCADSSYNELKWYLHHFLKLNAGSFIEFEEGLVKVNGVGKNRFIRSFVAFGASIQGFEHCRPMLFIDGTFLSGRYGGVLLSATAKDGDNGLFPLAFAIVDSENKDNWRWFLLNLLSVIPHDRKIIFVSDRHSGLMQLFHDEFTDYHNFYCLQHLKRNLRDRLKGRALKPHEKEKVVDLFTDAARAPTIRIFDATLAEYKSAGGKKAIEFIADMPLEKWAFAHAPTARFGEMTSNAAESYNKWILDARKLPITQCVDKIRSQTMELLYNRRTAAASWPSGSLCGAKQKEWNRVCKAARHWNVRRATEYVFEFLLEPTIVVRLDERKCDCFGWQFHGYPCNHAIAAIDMSSHGIDKYVDPYYFADSYKATYRGSIMPVATILKLTDFDQNWPKVFPPHKLRQPRRPKKKRILSIGEHGSRKKRSYRCKTCQNYGHGSGKCKAPIR